MALALHHEQYSQVEREEHGFSLRNLILLLIDALTNPIYLLGLALLVAVMLAGKSTLGSQRWIDLGVFDLQPSEVAKICVVLALARYLADHEDTLDHARHIPVTLIMVGIPAVLIARQPDLGTALTLAAVWVAMVVMAGVPWRYFVVLTAAAVAAAPLLWTRVLTEYQRERLLTFLNPQADPLGAGYNIIQSRISVGAGGLFGRGLNSGTQSQLNFLRVQHTDYIFAVLGEELGFVGGVILIGLYAILIMQIISIAGRSRHVRSPDCRRNRRHAPVSGIRQYRYEHRAESGNGNSSTVHQLRPQLADYAAGLRWPAGEHCLASPERRRDGRHSGMMALT